MLGRGNSDPSQAPGVVSAVSRAGPALSRRFGKIQVPRTEPTLSWAPVAALPPRRWEAGSRTGCFMRTRARWGGQEAVSQSGRRQEDRQRTVNSRCPITERCFPQLETRRRHSRGRCQSGTGTRRSDSSSQRSQPCLCPLTPHQPAPAHVSHSLKPASRCSSSK